MDNDWRVEQQLLLEQLGYSPDAYVVVRPADLLALIEPALHATRDSHGNVRPGRTAWALARLLKRDGYIVDTRPDRLQEVNAQT